MKSMMNDSNTDDGNNHNWLGFSLSPHMKMEVTTSAPPPHHHHFHHHHQQQQQQQLQVSAPVSNTTVPTTFYTNSGICYGVGENASPFHHSPLTVMPLKSDGSLCIMEALTRSQQTQVMVPTSSPKLEDFLGGATMGSHDYGSQQREAMALSLDSIYYAQNAAESHQQNRDHSLDLLSESFRQQGNPFYSALACHNIYQPPLHQQQPPPPKQTHNNNSNGCSSQMPQIAEEEEEEEGIGCLKNMVAPPRDHHPHHHNQYSGLEQQVNGGNIGEMQSLSLSMSPGSQSSCVTVPNRQISPSGNDSVVAIIDGKKRGSAKLGGQKQPVHRKSIDTFGQRTSQYRGVTRHRWTGRYEAHLWDNSCKKEGQTRKGRQVYLGGYDMEEKAARAYDLAALKYWGPSTHINFPLENYQAELEEMKNMSRQEYVAHLRRKSSGFSRGASMYRGVTRHHQHGRWQARIGRVAGNKDLYLGTFSTQEEAAEAYDVAAIKFRGVNAVTNFDISRYDVERIMASNTLLAGEMARRNKEGEPRTLAIEYNNNNVVVSSQGNGESVQARNNHNNENDSGWKMALYQHNPQQQQQQQSNNSNNNNNGCDQKTMNCGNYRSSPVVYSVGLQDLIGIDSIGSGQQAQMVDESTKIGGATPHFSNPSSLVTSLSSSREASPDKMGPSLLFPKPSVETKIVNPLSNGVSSWFPSAAAAAQMRPSPAISLSHLPVFAAWNDT